jgi:hypothetical protein
MPAPDTATLKYILSATSQLFNTTVFSTFVGSVCKGESGDTKEPCTFDSVPHSEECSADVSSFDDLNFVHFKFFCLMCFF